MAIEPWKMTAEEFLRRAERILDDIASDPVRAVPRNDLVSLVQDVVVHGFMFRDEEGEYDRGYEDGYDKAWYDAKYEIE